jgi:hypothetical protein
MRTGDRFLLDDPMPGCNGQKLPAGEYSVMSMDMRAAKVRAEKTGREYWTLTQSLKDLPITAWRAKSMALRAGIGQQVAQEILRQIKAIDRHALMAWGAKNFVSSDTGDTIGYGKAGPGVWFDVKGPKFRGRIIIGLSPMDTYTVIAGTIRRPSIRTLDDIDKTPGTGWTIKKVVEDVYADSLVQVLDGIIG